VRKVVTHSPEETVRLGARLGNLLVPGDFIALTGELGSGKTQFAKGVAAGLAVDPAVHVTSPTYTLMNIYHGRLPFYHFDLYRLAGDTEAAELGFAEYFYGDGVCLVEWAERLQGEMPAERLEVIFSHEAIDERRLELVPFGARYDKLVRELFSAA
jgi:tRNA threonylcarbamoyladenosine biosynthesis protein TsaE